MSDPIPVTTTRRGPGARIALYAVEFLLVIVIIGLLLATWLPAIIGGNPP
jgi:hypothetical protein